MCRHVSVIWADGELAAHERSLESNFNTVLDSEALQHRERRDRDRLARRSTCANMGCVGPSSALSLWPVGVLSRRARETGARETGDVSQPHACFDASGAPYGEDQPP
jgi:hypothetical protein